MYVSVTVPMPGRELALVNTSQASDLFRDLEARLRHRQGFAVATINLDHVVKLRSGNEFLGAYSRHSHVVADGNPIVWLRRLARQPVELMTGADMIDPLMELAARLDIPVGFLGSNEQTLRVAAERLTERHPGLNVVACIAPPYGLDPSGPDADKALSALTEAGARLCLLALGAPKQELLAARGILTVPECGFVSIGAGLDFISGHQTRAPRWMRRVALEWLWRAASEPRRLGRRYIACFRVLPSLVGQALTLRRVNKRGR